MNKVLPFENLVLRTKLSKGQAIEKLKESIEAEKSFGFGAQNYTYSKPFIGTVNADSFKIKRAISYHNSFLPLIKGKVIGDNIWTKVNVSMKPHGFVIAFMAIWFSGMTIGCFATAYVILTEDFNPFLLIPFVMLLFGAALVVGAFKTESSKSKKDLLNLLEAEIEE